MPKSQLVHEESQGGDEAMTYKQGRVGKRFNRSRTLSGGGTSAAACGPGQVACATAGGHVCCSAESGGCDDPLCGLNITNEPSGGSSSSGSRPSRKRRMGRR